MSIIYACVAHKDTILAEHSTKKGNFTKVVKVILEKISPTEGKMTYTFEQHYFHYVVSDGMVYICMADEEFGRRVPFVFLDDIQTRFQSTYGQRGKGAIAYGMQADFGRILAKQIEFFSDAHNSDKIRQAKADLSAVSEIALANIDKVIKRGEQIELLVDRTENLSATSVQFKKKSTELKNAMWWKNVKIMAGIAVVVLVIIYIILAIACGGMSIPKCRPNPPEPQPQPMTPLTTTTGTTTTGGATTTGGSTTGAATTTGGGTTTAASV